LKKGVSKGVGVRMGLNELWVKLGMSVRMGMRKGTRLVMRIGVG